MKNINRALLMLAGACLFGGSTFGMNQNVEPDLYEEARDLLKWNYRRLASTVTINTDEAFLEYLQNIVLEDGEDGLCVYGRCDWTLLIVAIDKDFKKSVNYILSFPKAAKYLGSFPTAFFIGGSVPAPFEIAFKRDDKELGKLLLESGARIHLGYIDEMIADSLKEKEFIMRSRNPNRSCYLPENLGIFKNWYLALFLSRDIELFKNNLIKYLGRKAYVDCEILTEK